MKDMRDVLGNTQKLYESNFILNLAPGDFTETRHEEVVIVNIHN